MRYPACIMEQGRYCAPERMESFQTTSSIFALPEQAKLSPGDFNQAAKLLKDRAGIVLGEHKQEMAVRTLARRAHAVGHSTVHEYLEELARNSFSPEWEMFINAFTINHTAFFREQHHFEILARFVRTRKKPISIWCSAASTGEEPYTIAITLRESCPQPDVGVSVWATDIDTNAIERAREGVYPKERVKPVSEEYLRKYFQRGTGRRAGMVRVKDNLRSIVEFGVFNLLQNDWPAPGSFDAIFCRNTMIYFDKDTQTKILERFAPTLKPGGLLFVGHSENFTYLTDVFRLQGQTVYVKK